MDATQKNLVDPLMWPKVIAITICMFYGFFGVFLSVWKQNHLAVSSCLILEMVCVNLLRINAAHMKGNLLQTHGPKTLTVLLVLGILAWIVTAVGSPFMIYEGIDTHQGFQVENDGYFFALISAVLGNIWSAVLIYDILRFKKMARQLPNSTSLPPLY